MNNIVKHDFDITKNRREELKGHKGLVLWFTGLSGSGKSTIANALEKVLFIQKIHTYTLDGDNVRNGLNSDLTFSAKDRTENIRRITEVSKLMLDAGQVIIVSFISPYQKDRAEARKAIGKNYFVEVFVNTPLEVCENRDVKGLYKKARKGEISNFTGIGSPYEPPLSPEIELDTAVLSIAASVEKITEYIAPKLVV